MKKNKPVYCLHVTELWGGGQNMSYTVLCYKKVYSNYLFPILKVHLYKKKRLNNIKIKFESNKNINSASRAQKCIHQKQ